MSLSHLLAALISIVAICSRARPESDRDLLRGDFLYYGARVDYW